MQNKLRVLFLQSQVQPWSMETVHRQILQKFNRERVEIHMACAIGPRGAKTPAYLMFEPVPDLHLRPTKFGRALFGDRSKWRTLHNLAVTGVAAPATLLGLASYVKRHRIDILHVPENPRDAVCGDFLRKATGVKSVIHLHGMCADWMRSAFLRAMRQADGVIGVSKFSADSAVGIGCKRDRVFHSLNGVNYRRWDYEIDGGPIREEFDIPADALVLAIVGFALPWKGHERILQALGGIKDHMPDFRFLIVGGDTPKPLTNHPSYVAYLRDQVRRLGLSRQVIFTGVRSDVPAILAATDLYTMPTSDEPCSLAILEAMAMKRAIVALDSGGSRELVEDGRSGLLSQPEDIEELAQNVLTLATDVQLRTRMGERGRQRIEEYLNPERQADEIEQIYRYVLAG